MKSYRTGMAVAVIGGYLLGRRKKAGLALALGTCLAGRHLGVNPDRLLPQALDAWRSSRVQDLADQLRGELLTASHAVVSAADRRLADIADALQDRTEALAGTDVTGRRGYGHLGDRHRDERYEDDHAPEDGYPEDDYEFDEDGRYGDGDEDAYEERDDTYDDAYDDEAHEDEDRQGPGCAGPDEHDDDEPAGAVGREPALRRR
jgi:hypothetical protein